MLLAGAAYLREYLAKHELAFKVGLANDQLRLAMEVGQISGLGLGHQERTRCLVRRPENHVWNPVRYLCWARRRLPSSRTPGRSGTEYREQSAPPCKATDRMRPSSASCGRTGPRAGSQRKVNSITHGWRPERMLGMAVDITERKQVEEVLRLRETELKEAQRLAQVGSWQWDPATDTVLWSEELYRIAGRDSALPAVSFQRARPCSTVLRVGRGCGRRLRKLSAPVHLTNSSWNGSRGRDEKVDQGSGRGASRQRGPQCRTTGHGPGHHRKQDKSKRLSPAPAGRVIEAEERERQPDLRGSSRGHWAAPCFLSD